MSDLAIRSSLSRHDLIMRVAGSTWFLLLAFSQAWGAISHLGDALWSRLLDQFGAATFFVILGLLISTRPPAQAQAEGLLPRLTAFVGTYMPWAIAFAGHTDYVVPNLLSTVCMLGGTFFMIVTVLHLGRSFSIVPQARSVVQTGPYRWIRHPLYVAEEIAVLGLVLQSFTVLTAMIFVVHIGVQVCRVLYEENLLRRTFPDYSDYSESRWRTIPLVW